MHSFVRFIFTILVVGIVLNVAIVFLANAQSQRRQLLQDREDQRKLAQQFINFDKSLRRVDVVVESQRLGHDMTAAESTLLVRQYHSTGSDQSVSAAVQRVTIPGDRLAIYGMRLEFNSRFAEDVPEFQFLRDKQVVYFATICGENEKRGLAEGDERATLMPWWEVPDITRINILTMQPAIFEVRLWKYIWNRIPDESHPLPWKSNPLDTPPQNWKGNINVTFMAPAVTTVKLQHSYSAWISGNGEWGSLSWDQYSTGVAELTRTIIEQKKLQEASTRPQPAGAPAASRP
jgi:hypothetical protein